MVKGIAVLFCLGDGRWALRRSLCFLGASLGDIHPPPPPKQNYKIFVDFTGICLKQVNKECQTETLF